MEPLFSALFNQGGLGVGDCVLIRVPRRPANAIRKLYPRYVGPYIITKVRGSVLIIEPVHRPPRMRSTSHQVHKDRVRPCLEDYPNIHTWEELMLPFTDPGAIEPRLEEEADD